MTKRKRPLPYQEGDWFTIPLSDATCVIGRIARVGKRGVLFGFFFGPRRSKIPNEEELARLKPTDAIMQGCFGDLRLIRGGWPIIRNNGIWNRALWIMPSFGRIDSDGQVWEVEYNPDDPSRLLDERISTPSRVKHLPADALMGAGFVEKRLARLLGRDQRS